jgi:hypothetical protein
MYNERQDARLIPSGCCNPGKVRPTSTLIASEHNGFIAVIAIMADHCFTPLGLPRLHGALFTACLQQAHLQHIVLSDVVVREHH